MNDKKKSFESDALELHKKRKEMYESIDAVRASYIDASTGLIAQDLVHYRACPTCGADYPRPMFIKHGGTFVKCALCEMVYLNPVFKDEALFFHYRNNNNCQAIAHETEGEFYHRIYSRGLGMIEKQVQGGAMLDIGCSSGCFLDLAKKSGWKTYGIELNQSEMKIARQKGHLIWNSPIEELKFEVQFNVITMWDVFEHIKEGTKYLQRVRELLAPQGVLFLQVPNVSSFAARVMHERCNVFDGVEHVNLYSPDSIRFICEKNHFEVAQMETLIDEIQVTQKYLNYEDPYFSERDGKELSFLTSEFINNSMMGYKIQVLLKPNVTVY